MSSLLEAITAAEQKGDEAVLATVVKVEGSAYRRPGARMFIPLYGKTVGAISGGCLEADVAKKAWWLTDSGEPVVRRYSTGASEDEDDEEAYRDLLTPSSEISRSHENCDKVQDPYSLRCQPQVMGACLTQIRQAAEVLSVEANAVSDNPLVFAAEGDVISGGNFHAEPVAMAADNLALAIAEIGSLSERRISLMMDKHMSQLPPFLVANGGVNSGFMIAQVTAAALASENKALAHPHSVDSLPTSANQEDHVSMAPAAGKRLWEMADNVRGIIAIEWLAACQGLDFREGRKTSPKLEQARQALREQVSHYQQDRFFAPDIEAASQLLAERSLNLLLPEKVLPSL
ncbi:hypothetical protein D3879_12520 [Pseudomonas cavernicola]|uniref:XdhC- CoxI domain-containing protein n=1 Tax=Pseudomonas cavernicola TaxID=2320866 RepID=A0A418XNH5_9PSED|nr:hypothetical protein D3879_12520 [Pseudomonas cavernicola]